MSTWLPPPRLDWPPPCQLDWPPRELDWPPRQQDWPPHPPGWTDPPPRRLDWPPPPLWTDRLMDRRVSKHNFPVVLRTRAVKNDHLPWGRHSWTPHWLYSINCSGRTEAEVDLKVRKTCYRHLQDISNAKQFYFHWKDFLFVPVWNQIQTTNKNTDYLQGKSDYTQSIQSCTAR